MFSDLNQWILKLLLAPEFPASLIGAPREKYRNATQLAAAAGASVMSGFRFVERLKEEGFLDESEGLLSLVRRRELLERWREAASRRVQELNIRFVVRSSSGLKKLVGDFGGCVGLFAAADALQLGHVHGVPPHVYIRGRLDRMVLKPYIRPADPGELPDVIMRRAFAPRSIFGGCVQGGGLPVSDVLQIWLDVSGHPARGREQAALIYERVLDRVINAES
jgi:hypothetical protein